MQHGSIEVESGLGRTMLTGLVDHGGMAWTDWTGIGLDGLNMLM